MSGIEQEIADLSAGLERLRAAIASTIIGQEEAIRLLLCTLLAGGHALLEGVPGLGKTLLVRTLGQALDLTFKRIQFTPDLMPSDIIGSELLEENHGTGKRGFRFHRGPVFANLLLADEVNRSPPRTQSALLEAMQERAVSVAGETYPLERPFLVLATQNPIEQAGTYPLPEAQLDRFLLHLRVDYPSAVDELAILRTTTGRSVLPPTPVLSGAAIRAAQDVVRDVHVSEPLLDYANRLVRATRPASSSLPRVTELVAWGAGPRAGQALVLTSKAGAFLAGRLAVVAEDLRATAPAVLRHRVLLGFRGQADRVSPDDIVREVIESVPPPRAPLGEG